MSAGEALLTEDGMDSHQAKNVGGLTVHADQLGVVAPENGQTMYKYLSAIELQICAMSSAISRSEA